MRKTNLQVRLDEETAQRIDAFSGGARSAFVREAIVEKIQRERHRRLEEQWIAALRKQRPSAEKEEDRSWMKAESWGEP